MTYDIYRLIFMTKRQSAIREELLHTCRAAGILGKKQDALCALFDKKDRVECARVLESLLSTGELVLLAPELCVEKSVLDAVEARVKVSRLSLKLSVVEKR